MFALSSLYIKVCNNLLGDRLIGISCSPSGLHFEVTVMSYFSFSASLLMQEEGLFCLCTCFATWLPTSLVRHSCTWILLDLKNFFWWVAVCYSQVLIRCQHWGGWEKNAGWAGLLFPWVSSWFLVIWYYWVYASTLKLIRAIENCYRGQNAVWNVICLLYRACTFSYNFLERLIPSFSSEHSVQAFL